MSDLRTKADSRSAIAFGPSVARADLSRSNCRCGKAASFAKGNCSGFTLVELLVVIGIIVILIGILIPAISHVRTAARTASTQSLLVELQSAIEQYHTDFHAYPGPLNNDVMYWDRAVFQNTGQRIAVGSLNPTDPDPAVRQRLVRNLPGCVTGSENLVLGLLGGLEFAEDPANPGTGLFLAGQSQIRYNPALVGTGPRTLGYDFANRLMTAKTNQAKSAYLSSVADLSINSVNNDGTNPGHFKDQSGEANDSTIPEFVDRFPSPMPILYLRARVGANSITPSPLGPVVIGDAMNVRNGFRGSVPPLVTDPVPQYDLSQYFGYVGSFKGDWANGSIDRVILNGNDIPADPVRGVSIGDGKDVEYWYGPTGDTNVYSMNDEFAAGRGIRHGLMSMQPNAAGNVGDPDAYYPVGAPGYFRNPAFGTALGAGALQNQPRAKESYILISAGPDRVYGTADDITSFGPVMP